MAWTDGSDRLATDLQDVSQGDVLAGSGWLAASRGPGIAAAGGFDEAEGISGFAGGAIVLDGMPAYDWYHGCAPTAAAMLLAYWDLHVYSGYFDAEGWEALSVTTNVGDEISSAAHNAKYDPARDAQTLPDPPDTSLADFLHTSEGSLGFGSTWLSQVDPGIEGYTAYRGHALDASSHGFGSVAWQDIVQEIDDGRPMLFHVDSDANGVVDHTMAVLGYEDRGAEGHWYGSYTTWDEEERVAWFPFRPMETGDAYGIYSVTFVHDTAAALIA